MYGLIEIKNLYIHYNRDIIKNSDLILGDFGITVIKGESGSGKTSIIKNIIFEEKQFDKYIYNGKMIGSKDQINHLFSIMKQTNTFIEDLTIKEHFQLLKKMYNKKNIDDYINKLEVISTFNKYPNQLSGGEKNRISFLFCILKDTPIIILDEPTAALDSYFTKVMKDIILSEANNHLFIISTHDSLMIDIADTVYEIKSKQIFCIKKRINDEKNVYIPTKNVYNFSKFFLKMKKHNLSSNLFMLLFVSICVIATSLSIGYSFSKDNNHYDQLNYLINDEIIIYKPIMLQNEYFFSADGLENPITDEEVRLIKEIDGVKQLVPHIELNLQSTHESFEQQDNGEYHELSMTVLDNGESIYTLENISDIVTLVNYDEINDNQIEYRFCDEGIFLSQKLAEKLKINDEENYELSFMLPIPQNNILGDGEFSYMDEECYPVNWVQCKYLPVKIKIAGVLKGNSLCQWSYYSANALFISHDLLDTYINLFKETQSKTYYFDTNLLTYTQEYNEKNEITNVCYSNPWTANAYKIKIESPKDYTNVLNKVKELGFSTINFNDVESLDTIAYHISESFMIFSIFITIIIIIVYIILRYINLYKENSFIQFFSELNYSKLKICILLVEKHLVDTIISLILSLVLLIFFQLFCIKIDYVIAPITSITIYMIIGLLGLIEFIIPLLLGGICYDRT